MTRANVLTSTLLAVALQAGAATVTRYEGLCDASAAVALDSRHFVVADDERNTLQVYRRGKSAAVSQVPLDAFLGTAPGKESDIEGAARVGQRIYWIASHGRNKNGKLREERQRLFATEIDASTSPPTLKPVGAPYTRLLDDLLAAPALAPFDLATASGLAPEAQGGFNIEGLAATADGRLLVGLRNPIPQERALLVALDNPAAVVAGQAAAQIGAVQLLDLGGRGIRSIERIGNGYLIVAGPPADSGSFALYRWSGQAGDAPQAVPGVALGNLRPEALFEVPQTQQVQLLSDDGGVETAGVACKDRPAAQRAFRSIVLKRP